MNEKEEKVSWCIERKTIMLNNSKTNEAVRPVWATWCWGRFIYWVVDAPESPNVPQLFEEFKIRNYETDTNEWEKSQAWKSLRTIERKRALWRIPSCNSKFVALLSERWAETPAVIAFFAIRIFKTISNDIYRKNFFLGFNNTRSKKTLRLGVVWWRLSPTFLCFDYLKRQNCGLFKVVIINGLF